MKKNFGLMLLCATIVGFVSCDKEQTNERSEIVEVSFDVQFVQSGSMTRGAENAYSSFYNNHIKTKELVPEYYDLTITNSKNEKVAVLRGEWDITSLQLPTGTYKVTGSSNGDYSIASLKFDEEVNITSSGTITLTAQYDCFLLMFPTNNGAYTYEYVIGGGSTYKNYDMPKVDDVCYMFVKTATSFNSICYNLGEQDNYLYVNNESFDFQNGYYYYFDVVSGSFNIPEMENGGI